MNAKHTPGPWVADGSRVRIATPTKCGYREGLRIDTCYIEDAWENDPEAEANARLIAAAPDMLTALEAVVKAYDGPCVTRSEMDMVRAAIAKALGENT
jgi:hypothetical protein